MEVAVFSVFFIFNNNLLALRSSFCVEYKKLVSSAKIKFVSSAKIFLMHFVNHSHKAGKAEDLEEIPGVHRKYNYLIFYFLSSYEIYCWRLPKN